MLRVLKTEKPPFMLIVLMTIFGWFVINFVNYEGPLTVLDVKTDTSKAKLIGDSIICNENMYEITNISKAAIIHGLHIAFSFPDIVLGPRNVFDRRKIYHATLTAITPAALVDSAPIYSVNGTRVEFIIPVIQSGDTYRLKFLTDRDNDTDELPAPHLSCSEPVQLRIHGWRDWFLRNNFPINVTMLALFLSLILIYLARFPKKIY